MLFQFRFESADILNLNETTSSGFSRIFESTGKLEDLKTKELPLGINIFPINEVDIGSSFSSEYTFFINSIFKSSDKELIKISGQEILTDDVPVTTSSPLPFNKKPSE